MGLLTVDAITRLVGGTLRGDGTLRIAGVASLERAGPGDLSFLTSPRYQSALAATRAGAVLVAPAHAEAPCAGAARIVVADPQVALYHALAALSPDPEVPWGVDPTARLGVGTTWEGRVAVAAGAVLGAGVRLGPDCVIGVQARIGDGAVIGGHCVVAGHATVEAGSRLGDRVRLHPGARVGTAGFGFVAVDGVPRRLPAQGTCVLEDDVEVGANTTIDRGAVGTTVIGAHTKIDNLVQVAHHVRIGRRCLIMAQVGLAGSTVVEDDVYLAGQAGLAGHLTVGRGARVGAQGGVIGDVPAGAQVSGYPARGHREVLRQAAALHRLTPLAGRLERLADTAPD